jgi:hypothetical protein
VFVGEGLGIYKKFILASLEKKLGLDQKLKYSLKALPQVKGIITYQN